MKTILNTSFQSWFNAYTQAELPEFKGFIENLNPKERCKTVRRKVAVSKPETINFWIGQDLNPESITEPFNEI